VEFHPLLVNNNSNYWVVSLSKLKFWIKWNAIVSFILSALMFFTIIGIPISILSLWAGIELWKSQSLLNTISTFININKKNTNKENSFPVEEMVRSFKHIGRQFIIVLAINILIIFGMTITFTFSNKQNTQTNQLNSIMEKIIKDNNEVNK